jgi:hypothetical protein
MSLLESGFGCNAGAQVHAVNDGFLVDHHADGLANCRTSSNGFLGVEGQVTDVQTGCSST